MNPSKSLNAVVRAILMVKIDLQNHLKIHAKQNTSHEHIGLHIHQRKRKKQTILDIVRALQCVLFHFFSIKLLVTCRWCSIRFLIFPLDFYLDKILKKNAQETYNAIILVKRSLIKQPNLRSETKRKKEHDPKQSKKMSFSLKSRKQNMRALHVADPSTSIHSPCPKKNVTRHQCTTWIRHQEPRFVVLSLAIVKYFT